MRSAMRVAGLWGMALVSVALLAGRASANPKEVEPGVLVEDFEDGKLDQYWMKTFGNRVPPEAEIVKREGKAVLKLGGEIGWMQLGLKDRQFKDFVFEARIRKAFFRAGYAGLQFRSNYRVYFRQRGFVNLRDPHNRSLGESLTGHNIEEYKDFKVVCAGPVIRVYVDGELVLDSYDLKPVEGGLALITHSKHGFIDDYKIDTNVPGEHYIMVQPRAPDECLVFPPGKKLVLGFTAANLSESEKRIGVAATLKTWDDKALTETLRHQVRLAAGKRHDIDLDAGQLPAGYYKMILETTCAGKSMSVQQLPLAVQERGRGEYEPPAIPIAVYWKYQVSFMKPICRNTYMHAAARNLIDHGINTVVAGVGFIKEQADVLQQYGVAAITRSGALMDHPAVIGTLVSDEPKPEEIPKLKEDYLRIRERTDKPITTCMIGDAFGPHVVEAWNELAPIGGVRTFRWYGIKKHYYGVRRRLSYKGVPSFIEILRQVQRGGDTPYWVIMPSFGATDLDAYYCNPTPSEMKAMMHLSLAFGAEGLLFYTYQTEGKRWLALVDGTTLKPCDGKLAAMAEVAAKVAPHAELIKSLKHRGWGPRVDSYAVEVLGLDDGKPDESSEDGKLARDQYVYAVNLDPLETVKCRLFHLDPNAKITDLYADQEVEIRAEEVALRPGVKYNTGVVRLTLGPGEGKLLKQHQEWEQPKKVKYPNWVEQVPADRLLYLIDLKPTNKPTPGWLPQKKKWADMNGETPLYTDLHCPLGYKYPKSIYAQSETTIEYDLPEGYGRFVAAIGLGTRSLKSSTDFRVFVDGKLKYQSDLFKIGHPVVPVVVDIEGAKKLKLVTTDGGDGIGYDYGWWGEARLIKK